jgi:hypothetical protein
LQISPERTCYANALEVCLFDTGRLASMKWATSSDGERLQRVSSIRISLIYTNGSFGAVTSIGGQQTFPRSNFDALPCMSGLTDSGRTNQRNQAENEVG